MQEPNPVHAQHPCPHERNMFFVSATLSKPFYQSWSWFLRRIPGGFLHEHQHENCDLICAGKSDLEAQTCAECMFRPSKSTVQTLNPKRCLHLGCGMEFPVSMIGWNILCAESHLPFCTKLVGVSQALQNPRFCAVEFYIFLKHAFVI